MNKYLATLCLSILSTSMLYAEDLLDIYAKAKQEDPIFGAAYQSLLSASEKLPQARSGLLPTLNLNATTAQQKGKSAFNYGAYSNRDIQNWGVNLQATQPIFRVQNWAIYKQAGAQIRQAEADFLKARQDLILRVTQAYFDILIAKDSIDVYETQIKAVEYQLEAARKNYQAGITTITDIHEAKSRLDLANANLIASQTEFENKKAALEQIIGYQIESIAPLKKRVSIQQPLPANVKEWMDAAAINSPNVLFYKASLDAASYEITKNRAGHLPTLDLTASYGENYASGSMASPSDIKSRYRAGQVGLQLSLPIFTGGLTYSKTEEAQINHKKAKLELESAKRNAISGAKQAFYGMKNGIAQIKALDSAVTNSENSVESNKIGYKIGVRINIDVLNAEQQLANTKRELTKAKYETLLFGLKLKASNGILTDNDISEINGMLTAIPQKYSTNKYHEKGNKK
ncbi:MAG: TolC family outer membrane protein [Campylobacterales bacterium]